MNNKRMTFPVMPGSGTQRRVIVSDHKTVENLIAFMEAVVGAAEGTKRKEDMGGGFAHIKYGDSLPIHAGDVASYGRDLLRSLTGQINQQKKAERLVRERLESDVGAPQHDAVSVTVSTVATVTASVSGHGSFSPDAEIGRYADLARESLRFMNVKPGSRYHESASVSECLYCG